MKKQLFVWTFQSWHCTVLSPGWGPTWQLTSEAKDQKESTFLGVLSNVQLTLQDDLRFFQAKKWGWCGDLSAYRKQKTNNSQT